MKTASAATKAILATGQYVKLDFYEFTLVGSGVVLRFTNADIPLTVGGNTYYTGLTISRSSCRQKMGLEVQSMDINASPQGDSPAGPIAVGAHPFLQAVRLGFFDGAMVLFSKGFFNPPVLGVLDTSPGLVPWMQGKVSNAVASRSEAVITISDGTDGLSVAMPRNVIQAGCLHSVFDAGCSLNKASFTLSGHLLSAADRTYFQIDGTAATHYFDLGVISFHSGVNAGQSRTVKTYTSPGDYVTALSPFPATPAAGDAYSIVPGCDKTQSMCSTKYSNLAHFRGFPYVPVPETLYGGATPPPATAMDLIKRVIVGSNASGKFAPGTYEP